MNSRHLIMQSSIVMALLAGCAEAPENSHEVKENEIVFNDRNIEQIREEIVKASNAQTATVPDNTLAGRLYELAIAANATGLVRAESNLDIENCEILKEGETTVGYGSATLSSSTRLLTAHHVIFPRSATNKIQVAFGGQCLKATDCSGDMVPIKYGQPKKVENPLLANRLFAMSLHEWAYKNEINLRNTLRANWPFEVVNTAQQSYMPQASNNFTGKDALVLRISGKKDVAEMGNLMSGHFYLNRPGMLFGQVDSNPYSKDLSEFFKDRAPVWGTHFPEYNPYGNINGGNYLPVISEPGYRVAEEPGDSCANNNHTCIDANGSGGLATFPIDYQGCFGTTLDARDGSSGGGVYGLKRIYLGDGNWGGHYEDQVSQSGVFQGVFPAQKTGWDNPFDYVVFPSGMLEAPTASARVTATALDEAIINVSGTDTPETIVTVPSSCGELDENGKCTGSIFPKYATIGVVPGQADRNTQGEVDDVEGIAYEGWSSCGNEYSKRQLAVGVLGAATTSVDNAQTRIGSLNLVCAPRSCTSWSDNWPHLSVANHRTTGKVVNDKQVFDDMLMGEPSDSNRLTSWLQKARELREVEKVEQLRPVSYKLCPPNYMLNGIKVLEGAATHDLVGIESVLCIPTNSQPLNHPTTSKEFGERTDFKLWADDDPNIGTYDWAFYFGSDEQFSISPRIGMTNPSGPIETTATWLTCNSQSAIRGFKWSRNVMGVLRGLALECGDAPRPPLGPDGKNDESCEPEY